MTRQAEISDAGKIRGHVLVPVAEAALPVDDSMSLLAADQQQAGAEQEILNFHGLLCPKINPGGSSPADRSVIGRIAPRVDR